MNLLLSMMFSSNILFLLYLLVDFLTGDYFYARWKSNILKLSLMLSLLPAAFIRPIIESARQNFPVHSKLSSTISGSDQLLIVAPRGIHLTPSLRTELIILSLWLIIGLLSLCYHTFRYFSQKNKALSSMCSITEPSIMELLEQYKHLLKIRRPVKLYTCLTDIPPFTIGVLKPIILLPDQLLFDKNKLELVLHHELCHIKGYDNLFTFIRFFSVSLYWFNPLFYLLNSYIERESELACDDAVTQELTGSQKKAYSRLIIEIASGSIMKTSTYANALCPNSDQRCRKIIKERVKYIMKTRTRTKMKRWLSFILASLMILLSSFPAFASQGPHLYELYEDNGTPIWISPDEIVIFLSEDAANMLQTKANLSDYQFSDKRGTIYIVGGNQALTTPDVNHRHTYIDTKIYAHIKRTDGSYVVRAYLVTWCSQYGQVIKCAPIS